MKDCFHCIHDAMINSKLTILGSGRHRFCFTGNDDQYIIKVPKSYDGIIDNGIEAKTYRDYADKVLRNEYDMSRPHYAFCYIEKLWSVDLLIMERLIYPKREDALPEWTDFIDCMQVGYNKQGKLLAYDYGT